MIDSAIPQPSGGGPGGRRFKSCLPDSRAIAVQGAPELHPAQQNVVLNLGFHGDEAPPILDGRQAGLGPVPPTFPPTDARVGGQERHPPSPGSRSEDRIAFDRRCTLGEAGTGGRSRPTRVCRLCGGSLDGCRPHAVFCSGSCRALASRIRCVLSGEEPSGYTSLAMLLRRSKKRTRRLLGLSERTNPDADETAEVSA